MAIKSFNPYKKDDTIFWYFDDKRKHFKSEPFLRGFSDALNELVSEYIKEDVRDFHLLISDKEIPGQSTHATMTLESDKEFSVLYTLRSQEIDTKTVSISNFSYKYFGPKVPEVLYLRIERTVKW